VRRFWRSYGLSATLIALFLICLALQGFFNWHEWHDESIVHGQPLEVASFLTFYGGRIFENAQSEFLQLASFVLLSAWLVHRGSPQSKDGSERMEAMLQDALQRLERLERRS
jgi:hypothetical protein